MTAVERGQRVRVHVNLHNGLIAVADPSTRRVIQYARDITLTGVEFRVPPGGLTRVRQRRCREVFAYAVGWVQTVDKGFHLAVLDWLRPVTFNPFRDDTFVCNGQPIHEADEVTFADRSGWLPTPKGD